MLNKVVTGVYCEVVSVCGRPGCHSDRHQNLQSPPAPRYNEERPDEYPPPMPPTTHRSRLTSLFLIGLVDACACGRSRDECVQQKRASSIQWDVWCDGRTGHSMTLFRTVLHASQSRPNKQTRRASVNGRTGVLYARKFDQNAQN